MKKTICTFLSCLVLCSLSSMVLAKEGQSVVVSQNPMFLQNWQKGREYALNGRYELAREHLLLALAASQDRKSRDMVAAELDSVDLMIKTLR